MKAERNYDKIQGYDPRKKDFDQSFDEESRHDHPKPIWKLRFAACH